MRGLTLILAAAGVAALTLAAGAPATSVVPGEKQAFAAVKRAVATGKIDAAAAASYRAEIRRAASLARGLPADRGGRIVVALSEISPFVGKLTAPRAIALFGQLRANDDYFAKHWPPAPKTDVAGADGVVYRYFAGRCLEFHPLANFGALNAHIAAGDAEATQQLADALVARGIYQSGGGVVWEYYFPFSGGRPAWTSGMAQAVAAQAFARAATLVPDEATAYQRAAHAAYAVIPRQLLTSVAAGPWIRLYSFQSTPVLNAQLQAVISLASYATDSEDASAAALAGRMQRSAAATLARFDTGYWTYYALPRDYSDLDYQQYVVQLLTKLAPADPRFADASKRFATYEKQPPAFKLGTAGVGQVRFWLSKPSTVSVTSAAGPSQRLSLGDGWHTLAWAEPKRPGIYAVKLSAVDRAGNQAAFEALPIVRAIAPAKAAASTRSTASAKSGPASFVVGAGVDDPAQGALAAKLGLRAVRVGIAWPAPAAVPDPGLITALQRAPVGQQVIAELSASPLPVDDAGRAALAAYAASLAQQAPNVAELVLTPAPNAAGSAAYAAALSAVRDAVHAATPAVVVGAAIDGSVAPKATIAALGRALGAVAPDAIAFRPAPAPATGAWTIANVPQLSTALTQAFGAAPPVLLDGVVATSPAAYASALAATACSTGLSGFVLDRLADNPALPTVTTGIYDATGVAKTGAPDPRGRGRKCAARPRRLPRACDAGGGDDAHLPGAAREQHRDRSAARLRARLSLPRDAEQRSRAPGRRNTRLAGGWRGSVDRHAAAGEAGRGLLPRRRAAREPGQSGARRSRVERTDRRPVGLRSARCGRAARSRSLAATRAARSATSSSAACCHPQARRSSSRCRRCAPTTRCASCFSASRAAASPCTRT